VVLGHSAPAVDLLTERLRPAAFEVGDGEAGIGTLRADLKSMMRSVRLQLAATSKNFLKHRTLRAPASVFSVDASKRAVVLVSMLATCLRRVEVGATPRMKSMPLARHQSMTSGPQ
jgi:hypothetical protein